MSERHNAPDPKFGSGHVAGMARQGLRELRAALYPESNVAQQPDLGIAGNATPGEIAQSRSSDEYSLELSQWEGDGGSVVDARLRQVEADRDIRRRDNKGLERE